MTNQLITHRLLIDYSLTSLMTSISYTCCSGAAKGHVFSQATLLLARFGAVIGPIERVRSGQKKKQVRALSLIAGSLYIGFFSVPENGSRV